MLVDPDLLLMMLNEPGFENIIKMWFTDYNPLPSLSEMGFVKISENRWEHKSFGIGAKIKRKVTQKTSKDWTTCDIEHYTQEIEVAFLYKLNNPEKIVAAIVYQPVENQGLVISKRVLEDPSLAKTIDRLLTNGRNI
ncbi:hypothetical protein DRP04_07885 [Archaeoglobales archaeon]|nr:MAG: hypothetical protein DRP04_07885 [Archaeoglobales archaeon]